MTDTQDHETRGKGPGATLYTVVINGTPVELDDKVVTYGQLGELAFPGHGPEAMFTVTYHNADTSHGPRAGSGTLVDGESVQIRAKGTSFNVRLTTRS